MVWVSCIQAPAKDVTWCMPARRSSWRHLQGWCLEFLGHDIYLCDVDMYLSNRGSFILYSSQGYFWCYKAIPNLFDILGTKASCVQRFSLRIWTDLGCPSISSTHLGWGCFWLAIFMSSTARPTAEISVVHSPCDLTRGYCVLRWGPQGDQRIDLVGNHQMRSGLMPTRAPSTNSGHIGKYEHPL